MEDGDSLAFELGCKLGSLPTNYLGLTLDAKHLNSCLGQS